MSKSDVSVHNEDNDNDSKHIKVMCNEKRVNKGEVGD